MRRLNVFLIVAVMFCFLAAIIALAELAEKPDEPIVVPVGTMEVTVTASYGSITVSWQNQTHYGEVSLDIYLHSWWGDRFIADVTGGSYTISGLRPGLYIVGTVGKLNGHTGDPIAEWLYVPGKFDLFEMIADLF